MILLANLLGAIAAILSVVCTFFTWVVVIQALLSWVNPDPYNPIVRFLYAATEPLYRLIRRVIPRARYGAMDFSPIIALLLLLFVNAFLVQSLADYAAWLRMGSLPPRL